MFVVGSPKHPSRHMHLSFIPPPFVGVSRYAKLLLVLASSICLFEGNCLQALKEILPKEYLKPLAALALAVCLLAGLFFGLQLTVRVVESGSMCIPYGRECESILSLNHTFSGALHKGDLIIVQHVDAHTLNTDYPNSDIIVYKKPSDLSDTPIVHRIITSYQKNGVLYFETKGDGNGDKWPQIPPESQYDSKYFWNTGEGVPEDLVEGKVVLRVPYVGWITLILKEVFQDYPWVLPLMFCVIILLIVAQLVMPVIKRRDKSAA